MFYVGVALAVYAWTVFELARWEPQGGPREALAAVLGCVVVAAFWPITLMWRFLLGPADAAHPASSARILRAFARMRGAVAFPSAGSRR